MGFSIKNPKTDALARRVAAIKNVGLTRAVHEALQNELERELRKMTPLERSIEFAGAFRASGKPCKDIASR